MFYQYPNFPPGAFDDDRLERIERIAHGLAKAGIVQLKRKVIEFELPGGERVSGDIAPTGFTVYLGGFDWVTYPSPPQLLLKFPQFIPMPASSRSHGDDMSQLEAPLILPRALDVDPLDVDPLDVDPLVLDLLYVEPLIQLEDEEE